jgi:hypothetical protein
MAEQNANAVAITGGAVDGATVGATTAAAGTFTTLTANSTSQFGRSSVNYWQATGGATTKGVQFQALGSDTNISQVFQSKGTGAIDLAAGSSGVNISNGGTVTAITPTASGSGYTSIPSCTITAPTTAGGVQATGGPNMGLGTVVVASGGTGYTVGDVLTLSGGTGTAATVTVATLSGSAVATVTITTLGAYTILPSSPVTLTGGTGSGATLTVNTWVIRTNSFNITNAGSGYVEQPTVSFSGGGGSGAAAYATVGSGTIVRSLGTNFDFYTPTGAVGFRVNDNQAGTTTPAFFSVNGNNTNAFLNVLGGSGSNTGAYYISRGTGQHSFTTNAQTSTEQLRVSHTASAVNYVQVTGAATGGSPVISAQGSDTAVGLSLVSKGSSNIGFYTNSASSGLQFIVLNAASVANRLTVTGSATGVSPVLGVNGSDTNIDLTLTPKGTGLVRFGTYTAGAPTATGYISIKAADGTTYKLLVST